MIPSERLLPVRHDIAHGFLNKLQAWVGPKGKRYISRAPNEDRAEVMHNLHEEYSHNGLFANGGVFRLRSPREQMLFVHSARQARLRVVPFVGIKEGNPVMPFVSGHTLQQRVNLIKNERVLFHVVRHTLCDIAKAHAPQQKIVYGDRWLKNVLVTRGGHIFHIDFDIELSGAFAREFELSQFFYSLIRDTKNNGMLLAVLDACKLSKRLTHHDRSKTSGFLARYGEWFQLKHPQEEGRVRSVRKSVEEVITMIGK